jgi:hypothetical protein
METLYILLPYLFMICINVDERQGSRNREFVTDPSGTFITHTCPLLPPISTCTSVPFGFHWAVDYCSNGRWSCEYLCCVLAFVPRILCRWLPVSSLVVSLCACVIYSRYSSLFCLGFNPVFFYMFVWSSSLCLYTARCNLGKEILKTITHFCICLPITSYQRDRIIDH